jgi:hypothetical protein
LGLEDGTEIERAVGVVRIIQRVRMMPADENIRVLLTHSVQHPCIGAIALIADQHIPGVQTIMLEALSSKPRVTKLITRWSR